MNSSDGICDAANKSTAEDQVYNAIVRPSQEYASIVLDPYNKLYIDSIEMVKKKAARFVVINYHDLSPETITTIMVQQHWEIHVPSHK